MAERKVEVWEKNGLNVEEGLKRILNNFSSLKPYLMDSMCGTNEHMAKDATLASIRLGFSIRTLVKNC